MKWRANHLECLFTKLVISIFVDKSNASCSISSCNRWALMDDIHIHTHAHRGKERRGKQCNGIKHMKSIIKTHLDLHFFFRAKRQNSRVHFPSWASIARTLHIYLWYKREQFFLSFVLCAMCMCCWRIILSLCCIVSPLFSIWHLFLSAFSIFFTTNMVPINISLVYRRHNIKGTLLHIEFHVCVCSRTRHAYQQQQHQIQIQIRKQTVVNLIVWFSVFSVCCSARAFIFIRFGFYFYLHFYSNWKFCLKFMRVYERTNAVRA